MKQALYIVSYQKVALNMSSTCLGPTAQQYECW